MTGQKEEEKEKKEEKKGGGGEEGKLQTGRDYPVYYKLQATVIVKCPNPCLAIEEKRTVSKQWCVMHPKIWSISQTNPKKR